MLDNAATIRFLQHGIILHPINMNLSYPSRLVTNQG